MCRPGMRHFWTNDKKPYLCKRLTGTEVEDSTLIARVKAGDRGAFNELYGIYWASLVNYAGLFVGDDSEVIRKLYSQEIAGQIDAAVESLSPKCREVFRMSHIEGLSNREISERLGITLSTVENHIYNALKQLRQKLSHYKMLILLTMYILGR